MYQFHYYKKNLQSIDIVWKHTTEYVMNCEPKYLRDKKFIPKFKQRVSQAISRDLQEYSDSIKEILAAKRLKNYETIHGNIEYFIEYFGKENILNLYLKNKKENFVKSLNYSCNL